METKKKHQPQTVTLRYIATADFRLSERTIFDEIAKKRPNLANLSADANEMIVVKSGSGKQWLAVFGWREVLGFRGKKMRVLVSERHRLDGGTWSDLMIANYARDAGYRLAGLPTLEEIVAKLRRAVSFGGAS
jgi:hypothetical protein